MSIYESIHTVVVVTTQTTKQIIETIMATTIIKAPTPPFTRETAMVKIRMAENAWNSKNPETVKMAYSEDTVWRNRHVFVRGSASMLRGHLSEAPLWMQVLWTRCHVAIHYLI